MRIEEPDRTLLIAEDEMHYKSPGRTLDYLEHYATKILEGYYVFEHADVARLQRVCLRLGEGLAAEMDRQSSPRVNPTPGSGT